MNIVFTIGTMSAGGAERVISSIANSLATDNIHVTIVMWFDSPIFYTLNNKIEAITLKSNSKISKIREFRGLIQQIKPDIVMSFLAPVNMVTMIAMIGLKIKLIVSERNDPRHVPFNSVQRTARNFLYYFATGITTQTENNKNYFSQRLQSKCTVIFNPVNIKSEMQGIALKIEKRHKIVAISRLVKQKNLQMLINAFEQSLQKYPVYELYIYGEGDEENWLKQIVAQKRLNNKIFFPGSVEDVHDKIIDAEIFVLCSNFEGMPNALLEAMSLGLPCIATKVSGAIDLIDNGKNGVLIPVDDEQSLANEICKLLADKNRRDIIGKEASKLFDRLSPNVIIEQWKRYIADQIQG